MANNKEDREEKAKELKDELNDIVNDSASFNVGDFLAKPELLPELGDIEIFNYEEEVVECNTKAKQVLDSLAKLYLGDTPKLMDHEYIKLKLEEDSNIYAETLFLQRMSKKNYINQLRQIDNGDNNTRMHDVVNKSASEIRENIKFSLTLKTNMEDFYKKIRSDLGVIDVSESNEVLDEIKTQVVPEKESGEPGKGADTMIFDQRDINDMIQGIVNSNKIENENDDE